MSASILVGAILTFASTDGTQLQLTVSLSKPATAALSWGDLVQSSTGAAVRHVFRDLPAPKTPITYALSIAGERERRVGVKPLGDATHLRIAVYGDSRQGDAAHRLILGQIAARDPDVIVHTGDVVLYANDEEGWLRHLSASLPLSERIPLILSLGNHELYAPNPRDGVDPGGSRRAMREIPPPADALARAAGAPTAVFYVRVGPALFISLDSNTSLAEGSAQYRFLEDTLKQKGEARYVFASFHQGPLSSGPHGPHPDGPGLVRLFERGGVTASLAGHDHVYERIVQNGITYLVSGGGGAPLYPRARFTNGSRAFASTYNWVLITIDGPRVDFEAFSLEGATLDRGTIAPQPAADRDSGFVPSRGVPLLVLAGAALLFAFGWACLRIARAR